MRFVHVPDIELSEMPRATRQAIAQKAIAIRLAEEQHTARIRPLLPSSLRRLLEIPPDELDDGMIRFLKIDPARRTVDLRLICANSQVGYYKLHLKYKDVQLGNEIISLLCYLAQDHCTEFICQEIEVEEGKPAVFIHRIQWRTGVVTARYGDRRKYWRCDILNPETEIRFGGFELKRIPCTPTQFKNGSSTVKVIRESDEVRARDFLSQAALDE